MLTNQVMQYEAQATQVHGTVYSLAQTRVVEGHMVSLALVRLPDGAFVTAQVESQDALRIGDEVRFLDQRTASQVYRFRKIS